MNPYEVLGVSRSADQDTVKKAYKNLARKYHPDRNHDAGAEDIFKQVNTAYDVLGDEKKRKLWDEFGEVSTRPGFNPDQARGFPGFGGGGPFGTAGGVDIEEMLSSMFGAGGFRPKPQRGADMRATLKISMMRAILGGEETLIVGRPNGDRDQLRVRIPAGVKTGGTLRLRGQGLPPQRGGACGDLHIKLDVQPHAYLRRNGDDLELDVPITLLESIDGGTIMVPTPTGSVRVTIPAGVGASKRLRLRGKGVQCSPPGDLYLVLRPTVPTKLDKTQREAAEILEAAYGTDVRASLKASLDTL